MIESPYTPKEHPEYPGYYWSTQHPRVAVNKAGHCIQLINGLRSRAGDTVNLVGKHKLVNNSGVGPGTTLACIMCWAFIGPPPENAYKRGKGYMVEYADADNSNLYHTNLSWMMTPIQAIVDVKHPTVTESVDYPGYYNCSVFPDVAVNKVGGIVRITGPYKGKRTTGTVLKGGRIGISTYSHLQGKSNVVGLHIIMAYVFLGAPQPASNGLVPTLVKHIDGNLANNAITNLRWHPKRASAADQASNTKNAHFNTLAKLW